MNRYAHEGPDPITFPTTLSAELPGYATGRRSTSRCAPTMPAARRSPPVAADRSRSIPASARRFTCASTAAATPASSTAGLETTTAACRRPTRAAATGASIQARRATPRSRRAIPAGARCRATTTSPCTRDTRAGSDCTVSCSHEEIQEATPFDDCCPAGASHDGRQSRQRLLADVRQRRRRQGRDLRHGDPARHARRLPAHGRLPGRDVRPWCPDLERHLLGRMQLESDRHAVGQGPRQLLPARRHQRQRHRLPDRVWQRRGRDAAEAATSESHRARRAPAATTCDDGDACTIDYFLTKGCQPACEQRPDHDADLGRRLLSAGRDERDRRRLPAAMRQRRGRARRDAATVTLARRRVRCRRRTSSDVAGACSTRSWVIPISAPRIARSRSIDACNPYEKDGCCPEGCASAEDPDCSPACGDGFVQTTLGEECDTGLYRPTACPACARPRATTITHARTTTWSAPGRVPRAAFTCPSPNLVPATAAAFRVPRSIWIRTVRPCAATASSTGRPRSATSASGAGCPDAGDVQVDDACTTYAVTGRADNCSAACVATPVTACVGGDRCCPPGCTAVDDSDCPAICGDGVVETSRELRPRDHRGPAGRVRPHLR